MDKETNTAAHNRLRQLSAFCHAAQSGSISKAAKRMGLSQPSVSLHVQKLEKELNTVLFERKGPKISLTPSGERLLEIALPMVEGIERLPDLFSSFSDELVTGTVDIASGESTLLYLLPEYVHAFTRDYPQVKVRFHNVTGRDGMAMLRQDEVDFAIGSMLEIPDDMTFHPLFRYEPKLIVPYDHPLAKLNHVTLEDISPHGLILPPRHLSTWQVVRTIFRQHQIDYHVILEAGGWEVIKRYVEIGMGISIVTSICLKGNEPFKVFPLGDYFPERIYGVVQRRGKFLSNQAKRFLTSIQPDFFDVNRKDQSTAYEASIAMLKGLSDLSTE